MSFFKKLLGGDAKPATGQSTTGTSTPPKDPSKDPNMIRVFDAYGREFFITRQQWRDNVLVGNTDKNWGDPEKLAGFITQSLHDKFFEEMIKPAERLLELQPDAERSAVLLAIVYLKVKRLEDSEKVLRRFAGKHGETGTVLTNLAKVHAERGDQDKAVETLWRALQLDPNSDNGVGWYEVIHRDKGGEAAGLEALRRIAAIPGSWRAQLWLARAELKAKNADRALEFYRESLDRAGKPPPADLLMQMSGDLGNAGHLAEIPQLVEPRYDPQLHGLQVGNNLIKAHLDLGQLDDARKILDQLYALQRPDWKAALGYWDTELAKAGIGDGKVAEQAPLGITMMILEGPVWLKPDSPASALFRRKASGGPMIGFLACSAETANAPQRITRQLSDTPGRLSRALPLFLCEQIEFRCDVRTQTIVPWIVEPHGGFVLSNAAWADEDAVRSARQGECDHVVVIHLDAKEQTWTVGLRVIRTADAQRIGEFSTPFAPNDPAAGIKQIVDRLSELFTRTAGAQQQELPTNYTVPEGPRFPMYLLRLEQLLAVRCANTEGTKPDFLSGEREIIDGNLQQCVDAPASVNARVLLAETLLATKRVRPEIVSEFSKRIALLQKEKPLNQPARDTVQRLFDEAFVA